MEKGKTKKIRSFVKIMYDYKLSIYHMSTFINVIVH